MSDDRDRLFGLSAEAREALIESMRTRRAQRREGRGPARDGTGEAASEPSATAPAPAQSRFEAMPGYRQIQVHRETADRLGIASPFFRVHEGIAGATTVIGGRTLVNFASYNYLDLCGHPAVSRAAAEAVERYGTSVSASRLVSGERAPQRALERALADLHQVEDCVVFVSGHATNVTTIGHLFGPGDLVLHDALIHNSVVQGAQLPGAHRLAFPHNDWRALETLLEQHRPRHERTLVVVEGHYGMDGDIPELDRFVAVKSRHDAFLMVDEAHSIGVLGRRGLGIGEHCGVAGGDVDLWMGTLSKTLAGCGGYIAGERALVDLLKHGAPGFVYSVGMPPPMAAASLAALSILRAEPERVERLHRRARLLLELARQHGLDTGLSSGHGIVPVILGRAATAARLANALFERGVNVLPIIHPAVPEGQARLRFFVSSAHTEDQIRTAVELTAEELARLR